MSAPQTLVDAILGAMRDGGEIVVNVVIVDGEAAPKIVWGVDPLDYLATDAYGARALADSCEAEGVFPVLVTLMRTAADVVDRKLREALN